MRVIKGVIIGSMLFATLAFAGVGAEAASPQGWKLAPVVPSFGKKDQQRLRARVVNGRKAGLRAKVFAKIGDSNTEFSPNLYGLACRSPKGISPNLRRTLNAWNKVRLPNPYALSNCRPWTSFSRHSAATLGGVTSFWSMTPVKDLPDVGYGHKPAGCALDVTPLQCELDVMRPRYALIMLGTNDLGLDYAFSITPGSEIVPRLAPLIKAVMARGIVPILSTIPPVIQTDPSRQQWFDEGVERTNAGIWKLSRTFKVPMMNLWRAFAAPGMVNRGLDADGLHLGVAGAGGGFGVDPGPTTFIDSVDFRPDALKYGANRRNLIWLKTLAGLDKITG